MHINYSEKDKENNIIATLTRSRVLHVSYASMALVRRPHHEPQLCILTLARTVPLPSIMTISNQPWYSKFARLMNQHQCVSDFRSVNTLTQSFIHDTSGKIGDQRWYNSHRFIVLVLYLFLCSHCV